MTIESSLERIALALEQLARVDEPAPEKPAASGKSGGSKSTASKPSTRSNSKKGTQKPSGAKDSKKEPEKEPEKEEEEGPTLADVRKALTALQKNTDAATARSVLKEVGKAATLSQLDEDLYQAVIDAAAE